ncbi:MAG: hypothetical protein A2015_13980 [Spirochaetes bacterium GWF1_31_7]|nr:MAG: hypothetical protein A2Y30_03770 [Spirochaetes bacterium GWE1_32_154]OHD48134.1 MAG: hypothetical protein A2Y29_10875 [Spirochaetes bacterium GWE2_31_10]OHD50511.1 MAG: hypothetical protein A2015_13980 [Spirochaetes bacterium GWF1_31_7]HBD94160.1 hypothetical protein [Spirochaetia bacterium]HBI36613.1 hypothetical protein [Spirochaetia bacterium]
MSHHNTKRTGYSANDFIYDTVIKKQSELVTNLDINSLELSDLIDCEEIQKMMDNFTALTGMVTAVLDVKGTVLVASGWLDICTQFHRVNCITSAYCTESDCYLAKKLKKGEFIDYKCKNGLWDVVTPLFIGDKHFGNIFTGQFFYDTDDIDENYFIKQAQLYNFDQESYIKALRKVPKYEKKTIKKLMLFLVNFFIQISNNCYASFLLAKESIEVKKATDELKKSEARFRNSLEYMPIPISIANSSDEIVMVNKQFTNTYGYTIEDIPTIEKWYLSAYPDRKYRDIQNAQWVKKVEYAKKNNIPTPPSNYSVVCKNGDVKSVEISAYIENDIIVGIFEDVTEQNKAKAEIQRANEELAAMNEELSATIEEMEAANEELLVTGDELRKNENALYSEKIFAEALLECLPGYLYVYDDQGNLIRWNKKHETMTGYSGEELSHMNMSDWFEGEDAVRVVAAVNEVLTTGYGDVEANLLIKGGGKLLIHSNGVRLEMNGKMYFVGVGIDITRYKETEDELIKAREIAENTTKNLEKEIELKEELYKQLVHAQKMEAVGVLAGGIAHDFNNMLAGITGTVQLLKQTEYSKEKQNNYYDLILKTCDRAASLTSKLLLFSRKNDYSNKIIDIHSVILDTAEILRTTIDKKMSIVVETNATKSLVKGDPAQITNALLNMGINSSHAMSGGGELYFKTSTIELDENYCNASLFDLVPADYVKIEVSDTGSGIKPENIGKIFDPFFTTKGIGEGTGLGLSAVYGLVKSLRGEITVKSEYQKGTTFSILIPLAHVTATIEENSTTIERGSGVILLAEDDEVLRETTRDLVEALGYDVLTAQNGKEAILVFEDNKDTIDTVILDMAMPVMNGKETFYEIKKIKSDVRVIICSGYFKENDIIELKENGLDYVITKPYNIEELSHILKK